MEYTIEDTFDVSPTRFWEIFFSEAFNAALWPALDITCEALTVHREIRLTPQREVPRALRSLINSTVSYVETDDFKAANDTMQTRTTPSFMADRIDNHGTFRLERLGDTRVKRIWAGHCVAKVPLLGGRVEDFLVDQIRESYRKTTAFTRDWIARHRDSA